MPISAVASSFNEKQICSACEYHDVYESLSTEQWSDRKKIFEKILNENKSNSNYDCIIPVSGGKDSYFQAHKIIKNLI